MLDYTKIYSEWIIDLNGKMKLCKTFRKKIE